MSEKYLISKKDLEKILMKFEDYSISHETNKLLLKKMTRFLNNSEKSFDEIANEICEKLPEKYEIVLFFVNGYRELRLIFPDTDAFEVYECENGDLEKKLFKALNDACENTGKN